VLSAQVLLLVLAVGNTKQGQHSCLAPTAQLFKHQLLLSTIISSDLWCTYSLQAVQYPPVALTDVPAAKALAIAALLPAAAADSSCCVLLMCGCVASTSNGLLES
jgi:hypothetical protein